jgi:hypothetical protein
MGGRFPAWAHFIPQLGKVMPIQINAVARTETKTVVRYETVEERRAAPVLAEEAGVAMLQRFSGGPDEHA